MHSLSTINLSICRLKDSRGHVCQVENMLRMSQELHHIKRARDQKLNSLKEEAAALDRRVEMLEQNVKGFFFSLLSQDKQHGDNTVTSPNVVSGCKKLSPVAALEEELKDKTDSLSERPFFVSTKSTQIETFFSVIRFFSFNSWCYLLCDREQNTWELKTAVEEWSKTKGIMSWGNHESTGGKYINNYYNNWRLF